MLRVRYVVLYVTDAEACRRFWVEQVGMVEKDRKELGDFSVVQVGFADQPFAFELVPLDMMADNAYGLDLATPSIALHAADLEEARAHLLERGVTALVLTRVLRLFRRLGAEVTVTANVPKSDA